MTNNKVLVNEIPTDYIRTKEKLVIHTGIYTSLHIFFNIMDSLVAEIIVITIHFRHRKTKQTNNKEKKSNS